MYKKKYSWYRVDAFDIYQFLTAYTKKYLYPPTLHEIAGACNCSLSTVKKRLAKLQSMGLISIKKKGTRTITLLDFELVQK